MNKISESCVVKLLPIIDKSGKAEWIIPIDKLFIDRAFQFVYDMSRERILKNLTYEKKSKAISSIFLINILQEGKIKTVQIGRALQNLIVENPEKLLDVKSDYHIHVVVEQKQIMGKLLPSFDKSTIVKKEDWEKPVSDIECGEEWQAWIVANQDNNYLNHIEENSVFRKIDLLTSVFGDRVSEILAENRAKKISKVLSE